LVGVRHCSDVRSRNACSNARGSTSSSSGCFGWPRAADHGRPALDREALEAGIDDFRRLVAEPIRHRFSTARGGRAGCRATETASSTTAIRPLARKLVARMAERRRLRRRGRLDVRVPSAAPWPTGGVPVDPAFRAGKASKPDSLLHAMSQEFSKLRSFRS